VALICNVALRRCVNSRPCARSLLTFPMAARCSASDLAANPSDAPFVAATGVAVRIAVRFWPSSMAIEYRPRPSAPREIYTMDLTELVRSGAAPEDAVRRLRSRADWPLSPSGISRRQMERLYARVLAEVSSSASASASSGASESASRGTGLSSSSSSSSSSVAGYTASRYTDAKERCAALVGIPVGSATAPEKAASFAVAADVRRKDAPPRPRYRVSSRQRARAAERYASGIHREDDLRLSDSSGAASRMRLGGGSTDESESDEDVGCRVFTDSPL